MPGRRPRRRTARSPPRSRWRWPRAARDRTGRRPRRRGDGHRRARTAAPTAKPVGLDLRRGRGRSAAPSVRRYLWTGDRSENKRDSAAAALELLLERVEAAGVTARVTSADRRRRGRPRAGPARRGPIRPRRADPRRRRRRRRGVAPRRCSPRGPVRSSTGCDPGGPSPYTPALDGARDPRRRRRTTPPTCARRARSPGAPRGDQGADRDRPRQPGAGRGARRRDPARAVAAGRRRRGRRAGPSSRSPGTHGKSTTAGLARPRAGRRPARDPSAFVGALLPAALTGSASPATARRGDGDAFVVEADEYAGNFDAYRPDVSGPDLARSGTTPTCSRTAAAVLAAFEAWLRRAGDAGPAAGRVVRRERRRPGRRPSSPSGWPTGPAGSSRTALVDVGPAAARRLRAGDRGAVRDGGRPGRRRCSAGSRPADRDGDDARDPRARPARGPGRPTRLPTAGRHNAANALAVAGAAAAARPRARGDRGRPRGLRRRRPPARAQGRGGAASSSTTTTATTRRRSARRSPRSASASRAGASGRSTSR